MDSRRLDTALRRDLRRVRKPLLSRAGPEGERKEYARTVHDQFAKSSKAKGTVCRW